MGWPGPMTDRQFRAWQSWIELDYNQPGKLESYVMRAALESARFTAKDPSSLKLDDMKVVFKFRSAEPAKRTISPKDEAQWAKDKWHWHLYRGKYAGIPHDG